MALYVSTLYVSTLYVSTLYVSVVLYMSFLMRVPILLRLGSEVTEAEMFDNGIDVSLFLMAWTILLVKLSGSEYLVIVKFLSWSVLMIFI